MALKIKCDSVWPPLPAQHKKPGEQQEGEHGWVEHIRGEHYQKNILRVFMIDRGLVGNPESSLVHRRSQKSINKSPNSKFLGLSLSTPVWLSICIQEIGSPEIKLKWQFELYDEDKSGTCMSLSL